MLLQREHLQATTIVRLGLLYCQQNSSLGQDGSKLNLVDLAKLPLTPILGNGLAPLQPLERTDAAERIAFLATSDSQDRPLDLQPRHTSNYPGAKKYVPSPEKVLMKARVRIYDGVGPDTLTMKELLQLMAKVQGRTLNPVHVNYFNMERILNVASLGNYNRQFVSILRSEQDFDVESNTPVNTARGSHVAFQQLLHKDATLHRIEDAFAAPEGGRRTRRKFPIKSTLKWVYRNPGVIRPGIALGVEITRNFLFPVHQGPFLAQEQAVKGSDLEQQAAAASKKSVE
jgi:hypothetical protein